MKEMDHENLITIVSERLDWARETTENVIAAILEVVKAELKAGNSVEIDNKGSLNPEIRSEYILLDPESGERILMPPSLEIILEVFLDVGNKTLLNDLVFTPEETFYNDLNVGFSQFEPTLLNDDIELGDIPVIEGEPDEMSDNEIEGAFEPDEAQFLLKEVATLSEKKMPPKAVEEKKRPHSRQWCVRKKSTIWIPIAGGIAIIVASLFFFERERKQ